MKVIPKQTEMIAFQYKENREFYINIGKYLKDITYRVEEPNDKCPTNKFIIVLSNKQKIELEEGDYLVIGKDYNSVVSEEIFKKEYIEINCRNEEL